MSPVKSMLPKLSTIKKFLFLERTIKPLFVSVKTSCSNKCIFCSRTHHPENIESSHQILLSELQSHHPRNYNRVEIGSDEPLNYVYITDLLSHIKGRGFHNICIQTTGRKLNDIYFLSELIHSGANEFRVPLYGTTAAIHDSITQIKGSFSETLQGLENLVKRRIKFALHTLILKQNLENLNDLQRFCHSKFNKKITYGLLHPDSEKATEYYQCAPKLTAIPSEIIENVDLFLPCIHHKDDKQRALDKEYTKRIGSASNKLRMKKHKISTCKSCVHFKSCEGYYLPYFAMYGTAEFQPITDLVKS